MQLWHTYYYAADELYSGNGPDDPKTSPLVTPSGSLIAMVSHRFAANLFIEGSGKLRDGRVVNVSDNTSGRESFSVAGFNGRPSYHVLSSAFPWGSSANGRPIVPMRSIAVDRSVIRAGSRVYLREFAGLTIPSVPGIQGFVHDGWFNADDTGGGICGPHIDIAAGSELMGQAMSRIFPTAWRSATQAGVGPGFTATVEAGTAPQSANCRAQLARGTTAPVAPVSAPAGAGPWFTAAALVAMGVGAWMISERGVPRGNPGDSILTKVKSRGSVHFSDRNKLANDRPERSERWRAFVSVFGYDVSGVGGTKEAAVSSAVAELPESIRRHFV